MNRYVVIPETVLEDWRELREFDYLNHLTQQHQDAQIQSQQDKEAADRAYWARNQRLVSVSFAYIFGVAALIGLAHTGAIAGWVMHLGSVIGTGWLVYQFIKS